MYAQPLSDGMAIVTNKTGFNTTGGDGFSNYSFQIFGAGENILAPLGQNWQPTFFTPTDPSIYEQWQGSNMGDLFGIAIDSEKNVYFAASKVAGLNIGSAGSAGVYKMNAEDWSISNFITTGNGINQIPNQNIGLGNICYDKWHDQLLITNFEDGKIYRYDMQGNFLSSFDPFNADDGSPGLPGFNETIWGINIFGTSSNDVKVYFSRWADEAPITSVWSVDLDVNGDFNGEESNCFNIAFQDLGSNYDRPISDITFNSDGKMYVCENSIRKYSEFNFFENASHESMVFEYSLINNSWEKTTNYFVGNFSNNRNSTGGVALGNKQTKNGIECEGLVWTTGDALKFFGSNINEFDNEVVYGAAAIPIGGNTQQNVQTTSIYVDTDVFGDGANGEKKYWMGDIEIYNETASSSSLTITPSTTICNGESIQLDVIGGSNYQWSPALNLDDSNSASPIATPNETTTYTVTDGEAGCGSSAVVTISVDEFSFSLGSDIFICDSNEVQIIDGGDQATSYLWNTGETTQTISTTGFGNYSLSITSPSGCEYEDEVSIVIDDFNFSLGPDIVNCITNKEQTLDAGEEAVDYLWSTGETTQFISVLGSGDFNVNITSPAGCNYSDEISIINSQLPTLTFNTPNNGSCPPATFILNDESVPIDGDPIVAWNWQVDGNTFNNSSVSINLQNSGSYSVSLEVTTELGCVETLTVDDYLNVFSSPTPEFITEPTELSKCDKTIELINLSADYDSLSWDFGDGTAINEDTVSTYTYSEVSNYTISLTTINDIGCESTFYKQITPENSILFYSPNAFTPDSDALNEVFLPLLGCHENFEFWVFNRWGENIFYSNDVNVGWDGTYKGRLSPIGIYSWKARYDGTKDNQVKFGEVHLMH
tara:strand:- start:54 stop:2699 length:2646 start_codon:yes stop_codon:yes gene_type:complete